MLIKRNKNKKSQETSVEKSEKVEKAQLHHEEYDENKEVTLFDPIDTWKKKKLEKGTYTVRELLEPIFINGECVYKSDSVMEIRDYCTKEKETLSEENKRFVNPHPVHVDLSYELWDLKNEMINGGRVKKIGGMNHNA